MLLRVLPAVYEKQPQAINRRLTELLALMSRLEQPEQYHLLRLLHVAAKTKQPEVEYIVYMTVHTTRHVSGSVTGCVPKGSCLMSLYTPSFR